MHLSDADLGALLDPGAGNARAGAARAHAAHCAACRLAIRHVEEDDRDVANALQLLDHATPALAVRALAWRPAAGAPKRALSMGLRRGTIALICAAAAAAAAVPGSPVRQWVERIAAPRGDTHTTALQPAPAATRTTAGGPAAPVPALAARGVAITAGRRVTIVFRAPEPSGTIRVRERGGDEVAVTAAGNGATYSVAAGRVAIDNRAAAGLTYDVELPPRTSGSDVVILVGPRTVFARRHGVVTAASPPAGADGTYALAMTASGQDRRR